MAVRLVAGMTLLLLSVAAAARGQTPGPAERVEGLPAADAMSEDQWLASAQQRIDQYRKADAIIRVVDSQQRPVAGAQIEATQTRHAFLFGCNLFLWGRAGQLRDEADYRRQFAELFNYATLPFYWPSYEQQSGRPDHEHAAAVARWCQQHGLLAKGHPLAWNYADPSWLPDDLNEVRRLQLARISDCTSRFRGLIDRWDVVNEATDFERQEFRQRAPKMTAMWEQAGRMEFVRECFREARAANPAATLLINDYRTDPQYERVVEQLVDERGRPLYDVIGIQSHMHGGTWSNRKIWETCQRFARFGVPLHFTETTIVSGQLGWDVASQSGGWPSTPEGEAYQAREVQRFYTMLFSHPAVEAITWWDFADRGAWKRAPAGLLRSNLSPKPAYLALLDLVKRQWRTEAKGVSDSSGELAFRGVLGDYQVSVRRGPGPPVEQPLRLEKGKQNLLTIVCP